MRVIVEVCYDMPAGVPVVWSDELVNGERTVDVWVAAGLCPATRGHIAEALAAAGIVLPRTAAA